MNNKNACVCYPEKGCFAPEDDICFFLHLPGRREAPLLHCTLLHLHERAGEWEIRPESGDGQKDCFRFSLPVPERWREAGRGFGLEVRPASSELEYFSASTAFDFRKPGVTPVRYGFLSDFDGGEEEGRIAFLLRMHATHVQFYDWVPAHHDYRSSLKRYRDLMGKHIDIELVRHLIRNCGEAGMKSLGYGAVYAASRSFLDGHPDWGVYDCEGKPFSLIDTFFIMNLENGSPWVDHIIEQYRYAVEGIGFDGIHMDTYGFPKKGFSADRRPLDLEEDFRNILKETGIALPSAELVFNNVGNWPVAGIADLARTAIYIEVWEPHARYRHIRSIILNAVRFGKPVVLAAYLAPFRTHGDDRRGCMNALLLLHAAIVSHGATHLVAGERGAVLTQGYYSDYSLLEAEEREEYIRICDYTVRFGELFFDPGLRDITETHTAGENREYFWEGAPVSIDGEPGTVWIIVREKPGRKVITLINLCGQENDRWNSIKGLPGPVRRFGITFPLDGSVDRVLLCRIDRPDQAAELMEYRKAEDVRTPSGTLLLEDLPFWSTITVDYSAQ